MNESHDRPDHLSSLTDVLVLAEEDPLILMGEDGSCLAEELATEEELAPQKSRKVGFPLVIGITWLSSRILGNLATISSGNQPLKSRINLIRSAMSMIVTHSDDNSHSNLLED